MLRIVRAFPTRARCFSALCVAVRAAAVLLLLLHRRCAQLGLSLRGRCAAELSAFAALRTHRSKACSHCSAAAELSPSAALRTRLAAARSLHLSCSEQWLQRGGRLCSDCCAVSSLLLVCPQDTQRVLRESLEK